MIIKLPKGYDRQIHFAICFLAVYGTLIIGSASMGLNIGNNHYLFFTILKQIVFVLIGYVAMVLLSNLFDISFVKSNKFLVLIGLTYLSLIACLAFDSAGGAKAWIRFGVGGKEVTIQPSEFAKITTMLIIAGYCGDNKRRYKTTWEFIKIPLVMILLIVLIVNGPQDDFGSAAVILSIAYACLLIPTHPKIRPFQLFIQIGFVILSGLLIFVLSPKGIQIIPSLPFLKEYQRNRFLSTVDPFFDYYNTGFQLTKGLSSFARGGWLGTGYGTSLNKYSEFPATDTDYILAILVEELGFVGFLVLFLLYGTIMFKCYSYALKIKSECGRVILVGTATYLLVHTLLNVGGVTGLIPLTGVPLIMISAGGSSTIAFMMSIGICQSVISSFNNGKLR